MDENAIRYRTDTAYGEGGHQPAEILAYECFELENVYLIEDLIALLERNLAEHETHPFVMSAKKFYKTLDDDKNYLFYHEDYTRVVPFMKELLNLLSEVTGMGINYLLWLTEFDIVIDLYGDGIVNKIKDVDAYECGFPLIEIACDGTLYAYDTKPQPLDKSYVKNALLKYESRKDKL